MFLLYLRVEDFVFNPHSGPIKSNCISGVMVNVLALSAVDRGFEPRSGITRDYKIGICCFSAKHASLRGKSKDWLVWNQSNVSEWGDMSICRLLFQWASTIKIQMDLIISLKINLFMPWYSWKIAEYSSLRYMYMWP